MNSQRRILLILIVVILIAAILLAIWLQNRKKCSSPSRQLVGNALPARPQQSNQKYTIILKPELEKVRDEIFRKTIDDIVLPENVVKDANYLKLTKAMSNYHRAPTQEELLNLLKYKLFLDRDDVYTVSGPRELEQAYVVILNILANNIPGDIVEIGAWKGGMSMWMKAVLKYQSNDEASSARTIWAFDTYDTFPPPETDSFADLDLKVHPITAVMYDKPYDVYEVRDNFQRFGLLDEQLKLVKGNFVDTLPASTELAQIAILRIDADYYNNIMTALNNLYFKISKGGYVIIDDYNNPAVGCKKAVTEFRTRYQITAKIIDTYGGSIYWQVE